MVIFSVFFKVNRCWLILCRCLRFVKWRSHLKWFSHILALNEYLIFTYACKTMLFIGISTENCCDSALLDAFQKCKVDLCSIISRRCISLKSKKPFFIMMVDSCENIIAFSGMLYFYKTRIQSYIALIMLYTNTLNSIIFFPYFPFRLFVNGRIHLSDFHLLYMCKYTLSD